MASSNDAQPRTDFAGIQALSSRGAGYAVAQKCLQVQAEAEDRDPSLRTQSGVSLHAEAWSWYVGALGEIEVGEMLKRLGPGWFVRHAVPIGAGTKDVDHLVVGPGGVFAINTKHHREGAVWIGDHIVKVNGEKYHHVKNAQRDGADVARRISGKVGFPVPVTPVLAVLNSRSIKDSRAADNRQVAVMDAEKLAGWLESQAQQLSSTELELIKFAAEEPETWHADPRAADTLRVMQRFERLASQVGKEPVREMPSARPASQVRSARPRHPAKAARSSGGPYRPVPRTSANRRRTPRGNSRMTGGDLVKMWMGLGMPVVAILIFRDLANQPCESPVACMLPAFYLGLRPLLVLAVPALLGTGMLGTLIWMVRRAL